MKKFFISVITVGLLFVGFQITSCGKKDSGFTSDKIEDYLQLETGKYIRYRLDSLRFTAFGQKDTIVSYQAKDVVEGPTTDNMGRAGWRIIRYLRDFNSTNDGDWSPLMTYSITPTSNSMELNENNFRYIKLTTPIKDGASWRGNGYLPNNPYQDLFEFSNDEDIQKWDYTYENVGASLTFNNITYDNTISVLQIADSANTTSNDPRVPASKSYWMEKYAKGVGLVYKEVEIWEYQPATTSQSAYTHGYGLKLTIIDHN
ncbi:hypothetical protein [Niastella sp. OAS944]|uniref:hypothetical protein n=1 Tax=Niastella sp. OAS944 TaxID=2664089 RepID=UPI00346ABFCD|nr:hypothetical protein [Chitinophagaceae bacterium OAS944]